MKNIYNCWLTLNRSCNLRCKWCYAKSTNYNALSNMPLDIAYRLIDMIKELNINHISLIGGEPTLYDDLGNILLYAKKNGITCGIITNGLKLSDEDYLHKLKDAGINSVGMSLKGSSVECFKNVTGVDGYYASLDAIQNLSDYNIPYNVSIVIDENNYSNFLEGIVDAKNKGARNFYISFEFDFSPLDKESNKKFDFYNKVFKKIDTFCKNYNRLCEITDDKFVLHQIFPNCIWNDNILYKMQEKNQIHTSCQLLQGSGIIFDTSGNLIPCNAMYDFVLGYIDKDFYDSITLKKFIESKYVDEFYKKILSPPSKRCVTCSQWKFCGGGCVSNWLCYDYDTLLENYKQYRLEHICDNT